ncbi:MAG: hypothetical protein MUP80_00485, partial [Acidobacteriia bacterium]|nr:hypothetical protein [Terriglobia bacterium]
GALVAQVLVLVPGPMPPPVGLHATAGRVLRDAAGHGQSRVLRLESGGRVLRVSLPAISITTCLWKP